MGDVELGYFFMKSLDKITESIGSLKYEMEISQVRDFVNELYEMDSRNKHVYICGAGRSGFVGMAFTTRLANLGYRVHFIGEASAPRMKEGDGLVAISGSGETPDVVNRARTSKELGAKVLAVTSKPESSLGRIADHTLCVPGRTKTDDFPEIEDSYENSQLRGFRTPLTPMGTEFEIKSWVALDAIISELANKKGVDEKFMKELHFD